MTWYRDLRMFETVTGYENYGGVQTKQGTFPTIELYVWFVSQLYGPGFHKDLSKSIAVCISRWRGAFYGNRIKISCPNVAVPFPVGSRCSLVTYFSSFPDSSVGTADVCFCCVMDSGFGLLTMLFFMNSDVWHLCNCGSSTIFNSSVWHWCLRDVDAIDGWSGTLKSRGV